VARGDVGLRKRTLNEINSTYCLSGERTFMLALAEDGAALGVRLGRAQERGQAGVGRGGARGGRGATCGREGGKRAFRVGRVQRDVADESLLMCLLLILAAVVLLAEAGKQVLQRLQGEGERVNLSSLRSQNVAHMVKLFMKFSLMLRF